MMNINEQQQTESRPFNLIKDLKPGMKNLNLQVIVLEIGLHLI